MTYMHPWQYGDGKHLAMEFGSVTFELSRRASLTAYTMHDDGTTTTGFGAVQARRYVRRFRAGGARAVVYISTSRYANGAIFPA